MMLLVLLLSLFAPFVYADPTKAVVAMRTETLVPFATRHSGGTGFIVDKQRGLILTNAHVVCPGASIGRFLLESIGGTFLPLKVIFIDRLADVAVVQCDPSKITHMEELKMANSEPEVGDTLILFGNEDGQRLGKISIKKGVFAGVVPLSCLPISLWACGTFFVNISGGSSGSPVLNTSGEVQGILHSGDYRNTQSHFTGVVRLREILQRAQACVDQKPCAGKGIKLFPHYQFDVKTSLELRHLIQDDPVLRGEKNLLVLRRIMYHPAKEYDLQLGDILLSVNGSKINGDLRALQSFVSQSKTLKLKLWRNGKVIFRTVDVEEREEAYQRFFQYGDLLFTELPPVTATFSSKARVVLASPKGWQFIYSVDGQPINTLADVERILDKVRWQPFALGLAPTPSWEGPDICWQGIYVPQPRRFAQKTSAPEGFFQAEVLWQEGVKS